MKVDDIAYQYRQYMTVQESAGQWIVNDSTWQRNTVNDSAWDNAVQCMAEGLLVDKISAGTISMDSTF